MSALPCLEVRFASLRRQPMLTSPCSDGSSPLVSPLFEKTEFGSLPWPDDEWGISSPSKPGGGVYQDGFSPVAVITTVAKRHALRIIKLGQSLLRSRFNILLAISSTVTKRRGHHTKLKASVWVTTILFYSYFSHLTARPFGKAK